MEHSRETLSEAMRCDTDDGVSGGHAYDGWMMP